MIMLNVNEILLELTACVTNGQLGKVNQILSYDFSDEIPNLVANEMVSVLKQQLPGIPILHYCVTDYASDGGYTSHNLAARRIEVAKYLLNFRNPALDLGVVDSSGLSVLHLAVVQGDAKVLQMIIKAIVLTDGSGSDSPERKNQLNINSRCHRQGWAAIHYAVDKGDLEALRVLIHSRANILVTMATDKRYTPLQLARLRLKATSSQSAVSSVYKSIVEELESAIEQQKAAKECDKSKSSVVIDGIDMMSMSIDDLSSLLQEKPIVAAEKKSGNKKKKVEKKAEKKKDKAAAKVQSPPAPPVSQVSSAIAPSQKGQLPSGAAVDQKGIVKPPTDKSKVTSKPTGVIAVSSKKASLPTVPVATPSKKINPTTTTTTTSSSTTSTTTSTTTSSMEMSIASRDELVDRLLAMGFREADCLVAISLYGTDIDQAISWLCDRPAPAALLQRDASKMKGVETTIGTASKVEPLNAVTAKPVFGSTTAPTLSNPSTEATAASSTNANSSVATSTAVVQVVVPIMQKEKDELRRINRAWNAKAEDEKRKLEAQRKQAELQKQQEALLAKQQQQEQLRLQQIQQQMYFQQQAQYLQGNGYYPLQSAAGTPLTATGPSYSHHGSFDSCHPVATPLSASSMSIHSLDPPPLVVGPHKAMMPYLSTVQGTLQTQTTSKSSSYSLAAHLLSSHQHRHTTPPMPSSSHGDMSNGMMTSSSHYSMNPSPLQTNSSSGVDHLYSSPHHSTAANYEYPNSTNASETFGAPPINSTQDNWSSPSYRPGQVDHLYSSSSSGKAFNSSVIHDVRRGHHDISTDSNQVDIVDGALELSAGAKEFVPSSARVREFSPGYGTSMSNPVPPMPALTPAVSSLGLALHQHPTLLYPPSSSSSSSLLGMGSAVIGSSAVIGGQPPGIASRSSIPPMPPLAVNHHANQSAWKLYQSATAHHQHTASTAASTPFMNMGIDTGGRHHLSAPPPPVQQLPLPQGQHSMFMSDYDLLLHSNHSFNAAANSSSDDHHHHHHDAYEYYDPSDEIAIMTDIDSFLSTDN